MSFVRIPLLIIAALATVALSSCDTNPTGPSTGTGNLLRATIDGTSYTFTLDPNQTWYDSLATYAYVFGRTASGAAEKTLTITFVADIVTGSFPRTLAQNDVNVILIDNSDAQTTAFDCITHNTARTMTLTRSNGRIVDGTFSGTLANRTSASQTVTISGGEFSVELR